MTNNAPIEYYEAEHAKFSYNRLSGRAVVAVRPEYNPRDFLEELAKMPGFRQAEQYCAFQKALKSPAKTENGWQVRWCKFDTLERELDEEKAFKP